MSLQAVGSAKQLSSYGGPILEIQFVGQPFSDQIGKRVKELLLQEGTRSRFLVAWGKTSGLSRLSNELTSSIKRGGRVEAIVGVDEGGASIEGLQGLIDLTTESYVFHNPRRPVRTFHPKLYIFENDQETNILIGSGNLTLGGLFRNYEAAAWVRVGPSDTADAKAFVEEANAYFEKFQTDPNACKNLTLELIEDLKQDPTLVILPEGKGRRSRGNGVPIQADQQRVFESSELDLLGDPPTVVHRVDGAQDIDLLFTDIDLQYPDPDSDTVTDELLPLQGFYKKLSDNDVSLTSSPGQIVIPIRFQEFFSPLEVTQDDRASGGPLKEERVVKGYFSSGAEIIDFQGRVILYTPAANHPRQNKEIRFTFHNRGVLTTLQAGHYLRFIRAGDLVSVTQHVESPGVSNFDWLEYTSGSSDEALEDQSGN
ncbi:hypothetical protein CXX84_03910 [Arthrobacter sp. AFG7.2]|uniref:phospholipase D family protein n=1 Tax=Arthrobacter sp. AFG7.2 TaxID=1688693 RepID=UPI000C9E9544|nr:phospholipase D family protein [Arthrobacter sp. AFG7.2]PNI09420.1 hypothetical protein CXX84_03910 [Arthrobacter sp. AFG7.2]